MEGDRSARWGPVGLAWFWLLAGIGICAAWRADFASQLGSREPGALAVTAAVAGALWIDFILIAGLASWLAVCQRRGRRGRVAGWAVTSVVFAWTAIARISDRMYYWFSGSHVDPIALEHLQGDAFGMELDERTRTLVLLSGGLAVLCLAAIVLCARALRALHVRHVALGVALPCALLGAGGSLLWRACDLDAGTRARLADLQAAPEVAILRLGFRQPRPARAVFLLHPTVKKKLRRFGLHIDESREFPLVEDRVFDEALPFPRTERWVATPNVIVIFLESFSAELTSVYGDRFPGLTPNLEDFAKTACVVEDFYNSSTPTVAALTCSYASYLPVTNTQTWYLESNNSGKTRVRGLPRILGERGWQTTHVHSLQNDFVRTGDAIRRLGFDEVLDAKAIGEELGERQAHWGFSDHQIFRFLVQRLKAGKHRAPFLLSAATIDSHAPFLPSREGPRFGDGTVPLLSSIHSADHAFGEFWRWFKDSPLRDDTIVVLLADHAMFPGKEHAEARPGVDLAGRYYDRILLAIYDPTHRLPRRLRVTSGQIDLAPTLLHLLDIDGPNHFDGHSIFGSRKSYPDLLAMHEYLFATLQRVDGQPRLANFKLADIEARCKSAKFDPSSPVLGECEYLHFFEWRRALHRANRVWP